MVEQSAGADPGKVIDRMGRTIGELHRQLATASVIIEDQDAIIDAYKAATAGQEVST